VLLQVRFHRFISLIIGHFQHMLLYFIFQSLLFQNMVGRGQVDPDLESETAEECARFGRVAECVIFELLDPSIPETQAVRIFVRFADEQGALAAQRELDGRMFDGRRVTASFYDEDKFERRELV
jgi:splicing factor 45